MCGIVGAIAQRDVTEILLEGLRRLEYRGYDSAGIAVFNKGESIQRKRALGKVNELCQVVHKNKLNGNMGIAHTRWATHGVPSENNAHPHMSGDEIALVHNGIIENYQHLQPKLLSDGYEYHSETDTESIAHLVHQNLSKNKDLLSAVQSTVKSLEGAYALGIMHQDDPDRMIAVRQGSPLVIGVGIGEYFIASDPMALLPVTQRFIYLEEGDIAEITRDKISIYDANGKDVDRAIQTSQLSNSATSRGNYRHFMLKEIYEQSDAINNTLEGRLGEKNVLEAAFGNNAHELLEKICKVQIVACGTSYHAGMVARYWLESIAKLPCSVEIASEFRYREKVVEPNTLFVTLSQSGETADTLAALRISKEQGYAGSLAICNVPESSLVRESDLVLMTRAGAEIGVASTKAFTTQLTALLLLTCVLGRHHGLDPKTENKIITELRSLPSQIKSVLDLDEHIEKLSQQFSDKHHALFLGRGVHFPIALEGALKLKEISYIHAEAYPAGELKHGPLALVDEDMPVIAVAPNDNLLEKLKSNLQEVKARGGKLYVFVDAHVDFPPEPGVTMLPMPKVGDSIAPILYTIPLQLLSYHVAVLKGTDVDQPRNLAKSVTVE